MKTRNLMAKILAISFALSSTATMARTNMVKGEVKKIDEAAGKITLKHGPIKSLDMDEGMTMVFRVQEPAMLKQVKVGDKVRFEVGRTASGVAITKMEKAK
ncbi:copper-binding protein [Nitrobacteraceae bacterium UC4446_H13]